MDFFFAQDDLQRMPPEHTRIETLDVEPYPDGRRVRISIRITPFEVRPQIDLTLTDSSGDEVAAASIVEPMSWKLELTMHLRGAQANPFTVQARLSFPDGVQSDPVSTVFEITPQP